MSITIKDVKKMAQLCNLVLSDDELETFSKYFSDTLKHIDNLAELDTKDVHPTYQVNNLQNIFRKKGNSTTLKQEEVVNIAKRSEDGLIVTDGVFD